MHRIEIEAGERILILDGAMGTMIQTYALGENDFRKSRFIHHNTDLKGNNDVLNITRPDIIEQIHLEYLIAGADIISTNTFGANRISQDDYKISEWVREINIKGAEIAQKAAERYKRECSSKPVFVAGAMGPTTRLASLSPDVNHPAHRSVYFDELVEVYREQALALIEGGVDLFLLETITDTLNAKAALYSLMEIFDQTGTKYPIMLSGTITDASGRILSGQTIEAFLISVSHAPLFSVGLNCALGADELRPYIETLHKESSFLISAHPNAGLPNYFGNYDQSAEEFANLATEFAQNGWLNIVGGCCGTTPAHIRVAAEKLKYIKPRGQNSGQKIQGLKTVMSAPKSLDFRKDFTLREIMEYISAIEDESAFYIFQQKFSEIKIQYHPEQLRLIDAHLFGRFQYLRVQGRLKRNAA